MENSEIQLQARKLVVDLDEAWARDHEYNLNKLKKYPTGEAILKATPEIQIAVARRILDVVGEFVERGKRKGEKNWFTLARFPWGCVYLQSSLLKKKLPFTTEDFEHMFGTLRKIGIISASQFDFIGSLVGALERHAEGHELSPQLRKDVGGFSEMLLGRQPDASDRKAGERLRRLLDGMLDLN